MSAISTMLIGAAGTAVATFFQNRTWARQTAHTERERRLTETKAVFDYFSGIYGKRLYLMQRLYWAYEDKKEEAETASRKAAYDAVLMEWNTNLPLNASKLSVYFGSPFSAYFGEHIQASFIKVNGMLNKFKRIQGEIPQEDKEEFWKSIVYIGNMIDYFLACMLEKIGEIAKEVH